MDAVAGAAVLWRNRAGEWHSMTASQRRRAAEVCRRAAFAWVDVVQLLREMGVTTQLVQPKIHDLVHLVYSLTLYGSSEATTTGAWCCFLHFLLLSAGF
jgi:hypothetical protein